MALQLSGDSPHIESTTLSFGFSDGTAAAPSITFDSDVDTGLYRIGVDTIGFTTGGVERGGWDGPTFYVGNDGQSSLAQPVEIETIVYSANQDPTGVLLKTISDIDSNTGWVGGLFMDSDSGGGPGIGLYSVNSITAGAQTFQPAVVARSGGANQQVLLYAGGSEACRIDSSGNFLVSKSSVDNSVAGFQALSDGATWMTRDANAPCHVNRTTNDGNLVVLQQAGTSEGLISVSGTTVTYGGGHLARWSRLPDESKPEIYKGTVMTNLDEMVVWEGEDNEQLNKTKISTLIADRNVAGLFDHWDNDDPDYNDFFVALTGDFVVRIAAGTVVQRGDLLCSAGDGTAMPQADDLVRSSTVAKVTSTVVSATYPDGSYAVPCVIMAC